jgi:hypothetical protein
MCKFGSIDDTKFFGGYMEDRNRNAQSIFARSTLTDNIMFQGTRINNCTPVLETWTTGDTGNTMQMQYVSEQVLGTRLAEAQYNEVTWRNKLEDSDGTLITGAINYDINGTLDHVQIVKDLQVRNATPSLSFVDTTAGTKSLAIECQSGVLRIMQESVAGSDVYDVEIHRYQTGLNVNTGIVRIDSLTPEIALNDISVNAKRAKLQYNNGDFRLYQEAVAGDGLYADKVFEFKVDVSTLQSDLVIENNTPALILKDVSGTTAKIENQSDVVRISLNDSTDPDTLVETFTSSRVQNASSVPLNPSSNEITTLGMPSKQWLNAFLKRLTLDNNVGITVSSASPEGVVDGNRGSVHLRTSSSNEVPAVYIKRSALGTLTGWHNINSSGFNVLPSLATAPASPVVGQTYYDTVLNQPRTWSGTAWVSASGGASAIESVFTPAFDFVNPATYTYQVGKKSVMGKLTTFTVDLIYSGLDTTDTSTVTLAGFGQAFSQETSHLQATIDWSKTTAFTGALTSSINVNATSNATAPRIQFEDFAGELKYNSGKINPAGRIRFIMTQFND